MSNLNRYFPRKNSNKSFWELICEATQQAYLDIMMSDKMIDAQEKRFVKTLSKDINDIFNTIFLK